MVIGIDEVGRGCWAGPLVVGAASLYIDIPGLDDSKKLNAKRRLHLNNLVYKNGKVGLGWASAFEIDKIGLTRATSLAMERALVTFCGKWTQIIVDGSFNYMPGVENVTAIPRADGFVPVVSAASIVAKVARDSYMQELAALYPGYGFEKHVGYGTRLHIDQLLLKGICPEHRLPFRPIRALRAPPRAVILDSRKIPALSDSPDARSSDFSTLGAAKATPTLGKITCSSPLGNSGEYEVLRKFSKDAPPAGNEAISSLIDKPGAAGPA